MKNAWLIGLYTVELDARINDLGYRLENVFADIDSVVAGDSAPELIVLSEVPDTEGADLPKVSEQFPQSLIISLPVNRFFLDQLPLGGERSAKRSVARLTQLIQGHACRWDN